MSSEALAKQHEMREIALPVIEKVEQHDIRLPEIA